MRYFGTGSRVQVHRKETDQSYATFGNYGLLDTLTVLNWAHKNVAFFGADPEYVAWCFLVVRVEQVCLEGYVGSQ